MEPNIYEVKLNKWSQLSILTSNFDPEMHKVIYSTTTVSLRTLNGDGPRFIIPKKHINSECVVNVMIIDKVSLEALSNKSIELGFKKK